MQELLKQSLDALKHHTAPVLPPPMNMGSAPAELDANDKSMWVSGWNDCRDYAVTAAPSAPAAPGDMVVVPVDRQQILHALDRQIAQLDAHAFRLQAVGDYSAEFPAEDADRMREARAMIAAAPAQPAVREPLTDEQIYDVYKAWLKTKGAAYTNYSEFAFLAGYRAAHGITGGGNLDDAFDAPAIVPGDMVMVPREPTSNMLAALSGEWHSSRHEKCRESYRAMIAAAPAQPAVRKCTQCPHVVGDAYQRDCAYPDCEQPAGAVVVSKDEQGQIVAVTRQDSEGRIPRVIAESAQPAVREPLTEGQVWQNDWIMAANAGIGLGMMEIMVFVRATERAHGITGGGK